MSGVHFLFCIKIQQKLAQIRPREVVKPLLPHQLPKQESENTDYEVLSKIPDAIPNLAKYCLENSLPEPIFETFDFGWYQKVIARVGQFEFFESGPPQTATKDAAIGLLNKIQELAEFQELNPIRTEARLTNAAGTLFFADSVFFSPLFDL